MFTYTTIFIGSLIVAVIALVVYRVAMSASKSILSSKGPLSITSSATNTRTGHTPVAVAGAAAWPSERVYAAPVNQVREPQPRQTTGTVNSSHCSLYDLDPTAPTDLSDAWPHREEKLEAGGNSYKVTRKVHPKS